MLMILLSGHVEEVEQNYQITSLANDQSWFEAKVRNNRFRNEIF